MKKLLALMMALVMTMSLVTISNAAFTDADSIEHTEAVEVMNALGVINGMGDGSFAPKGNVTRAQMAKMITIIMLGDVDASAFVGTATDLTDINGHWAEGFIKYCYSQGVIAGKGNGKFDPDANVTAVEAAKMLCVAIGYNSAVQQYVGADWQINVTRDAQISGFFNGLSVTSNKVLTRDEAAQIIYNAIDATLIEKTSSVDRDTGNVRDSYAPYTDKRDLLETTFKVVKVENRYMSDFVKDNSGTYKGTYTATLVPDVYDRVTRPVSFLKVEADYSDLLGQKVVLMFSDKDENGNYDPAKDSIIGIYPSYSNADTDLIEQSAVSRVSDKAVKADGVTYTFDSDVIASGLWIVEVDGDITAASLDVDQLVDKDSTDFLSFVDTDSDGKYDLAVQYAVDHGKVTYTDSAKVIVGSNTYKRDDNIIPTDLAKSDYVAIAWNFTEGKTELVELEKLSGKVTALNTTDTLAQINGEWLYNAPAVAIDQTYDYYVINGVIVEADQTTAAEIANLVFVANADASTTVAKNALVYYTDGTKATVAVDESDSKYPAPTAGKLYIVAKTDKGYKFKDLTDANFGDVDAADAVFTDYTYTAGVASDVVEASSKVSTIASKAISDDAVIFMYNSTTKDAKVISGEQLTKNQGASGTANANQVKTQSLGNFFTKVNGVDKIAIAAVEYNHTTWSGFNSAATASGYGVIVSNPITLPTSYSSYKIWTGSETIEVTDKDNAASALSKYTVIGYTSIANGEIKNAEICGAKFDPDTALAFGGSAEVGADALTGYESITGGYKLHFGATNSLTTDSKTVFMTINSGASAAEDVGCAYDALQLADKNYGVYSDNVIVATDASGVARVVIFDVTNRLVTSASSRVAIGALTGVTLKDSDGNVLSTGDNVKAGDLITVTIAAGMAKLNSTDALDISLSTPAESSKKSVTAGSSYVYVVAGTGSPIFTATA